jgi:hypothetical protein
LRLGYHPFFHFGANEAVLNCYSLAKFFGTDPDVFLKKPLSKIARALKRSNELIEKSKKAAKG